LVLFVEKVPKTIQGRKTLPAGRQVAIGRVQENSVFILLKQLIP
jgi:hypothetical protein